MKINNGGENGVKPAENPVTKPKIRININNVTICPSYKIPTNKMNAKATKIRLSNLSSIPPCPGINDE